MDTTFLNIFNLTFCSTQWFILCQRRQCLFCAHVLAHHNCSLLFHYIQTIKRKNKPPWRFVIEFLVIYLISQTYYMPMLSFHLSSSEYIKKKLTSIVAVVAFAATATSATKQEGRYHNSIVWVMKERSPPPYSTAVGYPSYLAVVYFFLLKTAPSYPPVTLSRLERYMHPRVALCRVFRRWRIVGSFQLSHGCCIGKKDNDVAMIGRLH